MDIYDYLKMDHDKVAHLFKLFEQSTLESRKREIVALINKELIVHAHAEQEIFYRALEKFPETRDIAQHGEQEHRELEAQLQKINTASQEQWNTEVLVLKELVEHHVKDEEQEMFNQAKSVISEENALMLKEKVHYLKGIFLQWLSKKEHESFEGEGIK
ncbi:hemerythrin domain-containing protein [Legionella lytica]|uniref:Hemerythrin domain-containing protein n=1 Tax=Legionella lytica TaxID=96232 RepID=A0ABW8DFE3_9GAMM